jgi:hypothetical protein
MSYNNNKNLFNKNSVLNGKKFLNSYNNPEIEVINQISFQHLKQVKKYIFRLKPIVESLIFLRRQNITLFDHHDDRSLNY